MSSNDDWLGREPETNSPYYPYRKVTAAVSLKGAEEIPYIITRYLMDLPSNGYEPPDDNRYPRTRLKKLIYHDCALPLSMPLPTAEQMKSIQFAPEIPDAPPDPKRGYRIYTQELVRQAQDVQQSIVRVYLGDANVTPSGRGGMIFRQDVVVAVMVNYALEANTKMAAASRAYDMAQAIVEAMSGVSFGGIGGFTIRSIRKFDDERVNTGYKIYGYMDWE